MEIIIKNMVCPRCITAVQDIFVRLKIPIISVELGTVEIQENLKPYQQNLLKLALIEKGFELLESKETKLINQIKSIVIEQIHYIVEAPQVNFSTLLSDQLRHDYSYLSRLFSAIEGKTIEQFIIIQKIEKAKELLSYGEMTLAEIAHRLHYSSSAYLSSQFKKITGMSPTIFRNLQDKNRKSLDEL